MKMKNVLIVESAAKFLAESGIFNNVGIRTFTAATNSELLEIHRREKMNLIINDALLPGPAAAVLCDTIRNDKALCDVSIITLCPDKASAARVSATCRVNAVFARPYSPEEIRSKAYVFLTAYPRATYRTAVTATVKNRGNNTPFFGRSENISASGMLLDSNRILFTNDVLSCSFFLPNRTRISLHGKVLRSEPHPLIKGLSRYGIKFVHPAGNTKSLIDSFARTWSYFEHFGAENGRATTASPLLLKRPVLAVPPRRTRPSVSTGS